MRTFLIILIFCAPIVSLGEVYSCVGIMSSAPAPAPAHSNISAELRPISNEELDPEKPEWKRISVRDPSDRLLDEGYLVRLFQSLNNEFAPWFEMKEPLHDLPYNEILRLEHIVLVTGQNGDQRYQGATLIAHDRSPSIIPEGRFRYENHSLDEDGHIMTFRTDAKIPELKSDHLQTMIDFYSTIPSSSKIKEPTEVFPDPFSSNLSSKDIIRLPGLDGVKIVNEVFEHYITHHYPAPKDVPAILRQMGIVMERLRQRNQEPKSDQNWDMTFQDLAEYLYLGIHCHPFEAGNFSLIMSQVNYILLKNNFRGISHENLDYVGLSIQFDEFKLKFHDLLAKENRQEARLKNIEREESEYVPLNIVAHISGQGDGIYSDREIIEDSKRRTSLEGIFIGHPSLPAGFKLQYMAHIQNEGDTLWVDAGTFLGTWGQSRVLEGLAFRIVGTHSDQYTVTYKLRVGSHEWLETRRDGAYSGTRGLSKGITGLKIEIRKNH